MKGHGEPAWKERALVILGHGSTVNGESGQPTRAHAERIRALGLFREVHCAFWLEEPYFNCVLSRVAAREVYLVPNFISRGYYTRQVIPQELGLAGRVSRSGGKTLFYCDPVGGHGSMTRALLHRAREVAGDAVEPREACLFVAGHGTPRNRNSTKAVYEQVERLRAMGIYGQCEAAFMEESPFIADWWKVARRENVVMVPFFIADGLHCREDIPVLLGITADVRRDGFPVPAAREGKRIWYAGAVGTDERMAEVIVEMVRSFDPAEPLDRY